MEVLTPEEVEELLWELEKRFGVVINGPQDDNKKERDVTVPAP